MKNIQLKKDNKSTINCNKEKNKYKLKKEIGIYDREISRIHDNYSLIQCAPSVKDSNELRSISYNEL